MQIRKWNKIAWVVSLGIFGACASEDVNNGATTVEGYSPEGTTTFASLGKDSAAKANGRQSLATIEYTIGGNGKFKWSANDHLWVEKSPGVWVKDIRNTIPVEGAKTAFFTFEGTFSAPKYNVLYNANPASENNPTQVVIPSTQTQVRVNDFGHLAESGDCGFSSAYKDARGDYYFRIAHAPAYLCLLPRSGDNMLAGGKVTKVKVATWPFSKTSLAGTFPFSSDGIGTNGTNTSEAVTLVAGTEGFPLRAINNATNPNAYYVVINPGEHIVQLQYTVVASDGKEYVINKSFDTEKRFYYPGQFYDITANLKAMPDGLDKYYFWDARVGEYAWKENTPGSVTYPVVPQNYIFSTKDGTGLPANTSDPRAERTTGTVAQNSAVNAPTKNQLGWIVWAASQGVHIYLDKTTTWTHLGGVYQFGIWLPKKSKVMSMRGYTGGPNMDNNVRLNYAELPTNYVRQGTPPNTNDYFYLPGLGYTNNNNPKVSTPNSILQVGAEGFYWLKTRDREPIVLNFSKVSEKVSIRKLSFFAPPNTVAYPLFELQ